MADFSGGFLMPDKKISDVFRAVDDRQKAARFGLEDMKNPERSRSGFYNAVVFGRMVTFALQNLRGVADGFDEWYSAKQEEMKQDPLMKYFYDLRTDIEKQTNRHTAPLTHIKSFDPGQDMRRFQPAPPGATGFFIGDQNGGSGWDVKLADGTIQKYYVDLPPDIGEVTVRLPKAPEPFANVPAHQLVEKYLSYLDGLVAEAKARFGD